VSHVEETIEFVASLPANDRIPVVQEVYESALIMAGGYNHELLKSEAGVIEELEQALGEPLPCCHRGNSRSEDARAAV
jgi:tRNA(Ile2) C34 agmatinyltransferase TiaS